MLYHRGNTISRTVIPTGSVFLYYYFFQNSVFVWNCTKRFITDIRRQGNINEVNILIGSFKEFIQFEDLVDEFLVSMQTRKIWLPNSFKTLRLLSIPTSLVF